MDTLRPYIMVDTETAWKSCIERLRAEPRVALDLEANSLYVYREQVCLVQASTPEADYIIDPLADFTLDGMGALLADPEIEKIFHASEYDLMLLKHHYDWDVANLFDTMWAARILGYTNMGLAGFLQELYDVKLSKKYQKTDWSRRPLSPEQLAYAQMDTYYLIELRDHFAGRLEAAGLMEEAREIFANEAQVRLPERSFDPDGFWTLRGARDLKPREMGVLKELYLFRDAEAARRNLPPFKVMNNELMVRLAVEAPASLGALHGMAAVPPQVKRRYGAKIVALIDKAKQAAPPKQPARRAPLEPAALERFEKLQQWRKETAQERGVESDVILTRQTLWAIARANPASLEELAELPGLGPYRLEQYGAQLLAQLNGWPEESNDA